MKNRHGQRTCPGGIAARAAERTKDLSGRDRGASGGSRRGGMGRDGGASGSRRESGSAGGASSSGDQVAASSAGGTSAVNVFQGSERPSVRTSTKAGLFKKIDGLVYPGRDGKEATDTEEEWERFAKYAVGTHGGASGYSRMSALRQRTGVKKEYDTLQSPCKNTTPCKRAYSDRQGPAGL
jgi:hypothetical protein